MKPIDDDKMVGVLLIDLCKAYYMVDHDILYTNWSFISVQIILLDALHLTLKVDHNAQSSKVNYL